MRSSWGCWLLICSTPRFIKGSPDIGTTTSLEPPQARLSADSSCADIVALTPQRTDPVVLQVLSKDYLTIENNFVYHMELHSSLTRNNLYVVCVDETSTEFMETDLRVRCVPYDHGGGWSRGHVWMLRVKVCRCLVLAGYNVLVSDADAVWLNDPIGDMNRLGIENSNIIGQRDTRPMDLAGYWGTTLCFGFLYFRAGGNIMTRLLDNTTTIAMKNYDDQKAFNFALFSLGIVWDDDSDMAVQSSKGVGSGVITDGDVRFEVSILPHSTYPRWCGHTPVVLNTTVVAHCLSSDAKGDPMSTWMRKVGAWHG